MRPLRSQVQLKLARPTCAMSRFGGSALPREHDVDPATGPGAFSRQRKAILERSIAGMAVGRGAGLATEILLNAPLCP
jgi:hypothetical protein